MGNGSVASVSMGSVISSYNLLKPQQQEKLFRKNGEQFAEYLMDVRKIGFEEDVEGPEYGHWEDNRYIESITANGTTTAGAAGADVDIVLAPGDIYTVGSNSFYYPVVGDVVMFPTLNGTNVSAYVAAIDASTPTAPIVTLRPQSSTGVIPAITAGDSLMIKTNIFGEHTYGPDARLTGATYHTNHVQITKQAIAQSGSQKTNETWVKVSEEGADIDTYWGEQLLAIEARASMDIEGAILHGELTTNPNAVADNGELLHGTRGVITAIMQDGFGDAVALGALTVAAFDDWSAYLEGEQAGNYMYAGMGFSRMNEWENVLKDYLDDTDISYTKQQMNEDLYYSDESKSAAINFKYLTKASRTFCAKKIGSWSDPKRYGISSYTEDQRILMAPMNRSHDNHTGQKTSSFGIRTKNKNGYKRMMELTYIHGAGNEHMKVTTLDGNRHELRSEFGSHQRGINQMIAVYGTSVA